MLRSHTCGELKTEDVNKEVTLSGWVQKIRDKGGLIWIDLRDRYGITQLLLEDGRSDSTLIETARKLGREFVIQAQGKVIERESKNPNMPTGDIEIDLSSLNILNSSKTPPFTIEDNTDGGEELRMKYRYLDLRRQPLRKNLELRNRLSIETRKYLDGQQFFEIETPYLIKSTPEGARDFVVPSRMNEGQFYALPQSPQTFKQLLMVAGYDRYYQLVKCFRDEDLRADRQPEFTQIDCEMAFVEQNDILNTFEGMVKYLFKTVKGVDIPELPRMEYADAMKYYGSDKPDIRFGMKFVELNYIAQNKGFKIFDDAELVVGIVAEGCAGYSRKQLDKLTDFVRKPQIGAKGLVYVKYNEDGSFKSSVDKFFDQEALKGWAEKMNAKPGDLMLVLSGETDKVRKQLGELRLEMGNRLELRNPDVFVPLWVVDFPLLEWNEDTERYHAMHHPFTSPKKENIKILNDFLKKKKRLICDAKLHNINDPFHEEDWQESLKQLSKSLIANAYDLVINGVEIGGGSIRIHDRGLQNKMFNILGFTDEEAQDQFGFLMNAFEYGAPPHGGIALGFDRLAALFGGQDSIRDFIAFPKNNSGRDVMIDSPSVIADEQLDELKLKVVK